MAIIWADFPSGAGGGLYGNNGSNLPAVMLDGLWASLDGDSLQAHYTNDPDPSVADGLAFRTCARVGKGGGRLVLPDLREVIGFAGRLYMTALPGSTNGVPTFEIRSTGNGQMAALRVNSTGNIYITGNDNTAVLTTDVPVITAATYNHIEAKFTRTGAFITDIEVRVNGKTVLDAEMLAIAAATSIAQVFLGTYGIGLAQNVDSAGAATWKDFVVWDNTGSVDNDFLGQVSVFWQRPIATLEPGGWLSNADADADETVDKPRLANVLTASGVISTGNQVRINNTYYNWTSGSVDAGAPAGTSANPWLVAMGASTAEALANMYDAIGGTGSPGVTYSTALTPHTTVTPFGLTETTIAVVPTNGTTVSMTFSETGTNTAWLSTGAFSYLVHDAIRMSANYIPAVSATGSVTFSGLPVADETVTINGQVYVFKAAAAGPLEVTIGADADATGTNFAAKVNANSIVVTAVNAGGVVALTAISAGTGGNAITLVEAASNTVVSGATLTGGVNTTYPAAFEVALEPLPDDVTSIRAVIPIVRAAKIDGGDGNIQASFGVSVPSYDDGPDTPITTAFTFWGNPTTPFVSEINPLTAAPWTPGEFNIGARMKVARTL